MCGIVGIFGIQSEPEKLRRRALEQSGKIRHRGPDWSGIYVGKTAILAHERLSIVDPKSGSQPLKTADGILFDYRTIAWHRVTSFRINTLIHCRFYHNAGRL